MRKGFFGICLSLVVAIVLLAAFVPSCGPTTPTTGTIVVQATLCGIAWPPQGTGAVNYTLTPTGGAPVSGTAVPTTHSNMTPASWTCAYLGGGPLGAFFNSIKPTATQSLSAGGTITFTFDFEKDQDAGISWLVWTRNGTPVLPQGPDTYIEDGVPCNIIDAHFLQWVDGCTGYNVTMNETSVLAVQYMNGPGGNPVDIVCVDDWWAVNKTPDPSKKVSQVPFFYGEPTHQGVNITLTPQMPLGILDVHTVWELVKGTNYTKNINWLGISTIPMFEQFGPHPGVLFELVLPMIPQGPHQWTFQLQTAAWVALVGDVDVNPVNNYTMSNTLWLTVWA